MGINERERKGETQGVEAPGRHYPYVVQVRFRNNSRSYSFGTYLDNIKQGDKIVVETIQGVEMGIATTASTSIDIYPQSKMSMKPVLRMADEEDILDYEDNQIYAKEAYAICQQEIEALALNMHLLSAEYMLDRTKVLFVYRSDERVDFRELLKKLSARLHCRIELRQIGERDKARMVGGVGICGRELCCSKFKSKMDVISINMAKNQLLALNTEKLSGMCNKLMCCLKYEDDNYKKLTDGLPKMGAHVEFEGEVYRVSSMNVMANVAHLENNETFQIITIDDLRERAKVVKGVAIAKGNKGQAKQIKVSKNVKENQEMHSFNATASEKNRGISDVSKDTSHQDNAQLTFRREKRNSGQINSRESYRHERQRPLANNNPNVTVRSFKSKKTLEKEGNQKTQ